MTRIAYSQRLPLGLLLARLTVAASDRFNDMPSTYGLSLAGAELAAMEEITSVSARQISDSLLTTYADGPADLAEYRHEDLGRSVGDITRYEWIHVARTAYCPDCIRETGGAWQLAWRLPWTFACVQHRGLLASHCPSCAQPAGRSRSDRSARPGHIGRVPDPELCGNAVPTGDSNFARPGLAARPCGHNLANALTASLPEHESPLLRAQARLDALVAHRGERDTWRDLRALTTVLLYLTDIDNLVGLAPDMAAAALAVEEIEAALTQRDTDNVDHARRRRLVREGGGDHRTGSKRRSGTSTPGDPALMAALVPIALRLHGALPTDQTPIADMDIELSDASLARLVDLARQRRKSLPSTLRELAASKALVERTENIARANGRFSYALPTRSSSPISAVNIPAYLWEEESQPFIACMPGTRQDTARMFASLHLVKIITGDTWAEAATRLGLPQKANIIPALVSRITKAGTRRQFLACTQELLNRVEAGDVAIVDYAARRSALRDLSTVPTAVFHNADPPLMATVARRRNSAAWLWARLTGGHPYEAPAWGKRDATESQREVYRRFLARDLPRVQVALDEHGDALVAGLSIKGRRAPAPLRHQCGPLNSSTSEKRH